MSFNRILKLAETYYKNNDIKALKELMVFIGPYIKKYAHYIPDEESKTPEFFKKNLDYDNKEQSPYFGSVREFLEKFPGGIGDWLEWRRKEEKK